MLDRDTIRRRLEGDGISYTEFSYMLLQANDFVELHQRHGCTLQIGGSDQWGNIIAGVRLVRQKLGASAHALTVPLVTSADGKKFGKSTGGGNVWLDPELTSPYAWYQYFFNTADADVIRYLRWFTFLSADELGELEEATAERPHERAAQRRLAQELTTLVHGQAATDAVELASQALFGRGELAGLDESTLAAALRETSVAELRPGVPDGIGDLLVATGLSKSKGEARRTLSEGGVYVNNVRVESDDWAPDAGGLPARQVAGAAPRQAEYRGRRAGVSEPLVDRLNFCRTRRLPGDLTLRYPARNLVQVVATRSRPQSATASQREVHFGGLPQLSALRASGFRRGVVARSGRVCCLRTQ